MTVGTDSSSVQTIVSRTRTPGDLPLEAQSEDGGLFYRMRAKHHVQEPKTAVDRASDEEIVALFAACLSARDRLIVLLLSRAGLCGAARRAQ